MLTPSPIKVAVALPGHVADIDPDTKLKTLILRQGNVALPHADLSCVSRWGA